MSLGLTLVSHVPEIANGLPKLLNQVAKMYRLLQLVELMTMILEPVWKKLCRPLIIIRQMKF